MPLEVKPGFDQVLLAENSTYNNDTIKNEANIHGIQLSCQTLANWMLYGANMWLKLFYDRIHSHLLQREILYADETTLQVLKKPGRKAESFSYIWLCPSVRKDTFDYKETRGSIHSKKLLSGFKGYLQVNGYSGYNQIPNVILVGCWAQAWRKFD